MLANHGKQFAPNAFCKQVVKWDNETIEFTKMMIFIITSLIVSSIVNAIALLNYFPPVEFVDSKLRFCRIAQAESFCII